MANLSRRYYERELGAGLGPSPTLKEHFGYSEPLRRFIQRESFEPQANEIPNNMPSWLPGDDYMTNFKKGDPFVKVDDGYARLPGAGYEALHPELKDVNPEDYPDIHKLRILSDVAPYSREYNQVFPSCSQQKTLAHARDGKAAGSTVGSVEFSIRHRMSTELFSRRPVVVGDTVDDLFFASQDPPTVAFPRSGTALAQPRFWHRSPVRKSVSNRQGNAFPLPSLDIFGLKSGKYMGQNGQ